LISMDWSEIKQHARRLIEKKQLHESYLKRLDDEIYEIEKQGLNDYWVEHITKRTQWQDNPFGLILPWIFNLTPVNPISTGEVYKIDDDGVEADIVVIETIDGAKYEVPADASIMTNRGVVLGRNLTTSDELVSVAP